MPNPKINSQESDQIAQLAHELWEQEGRPDGRALDHWLLAESRVRTPEPNSARSIQSQESRQITARQQLTVAPKQNESANGELNRAKAQKSRSRV